MKGNLIMASRLADWRMMNRKTGIAGPSRAEMRMIRRLRIRHLVLEKNTMRRDGTIN